MKKNIRTAFLTRINILILTVLFVSGAWAEESSRAGRDTMMEEIVVTGLKRDQSFIDSPVTVQVFGEKNIIEAGIKQPQDYLNLTPGITFITSNHHGEAFVNVRGQTSVRQSESAVAVVIDGVQLSTQNEFNGELFDIQQIEVLKGPQSAFYGRNASAGAIVIKTKDPTDEMEGSSSFSIGNWNSSKANMAVGGAIIPGELRFRASAAYSNTDGPYTNILTQEKPHRGKEILGRLRLDWEVNENLALDLRVGGSHFTGGAIGFNAQIAGTTTGGVSIPTSDMQKTDIPFVSDVPGLNVQDKYNVSLKIDYDIGSVLLTSITAWNEIEDNYQAKNFPYASYADPNNQYGIFSIIFGDRTQKFHIANDAFTQEIRLSSKDDGAFRWQFGVFYLSADRDFITEQGLNGRVQLDGLGNIIPPLSLDGFGNVVSTLQGGGAILPTKGIDGIGTINPTDSYDRNVFLADNTAVFGNIQYDILDNLELSVALRYDNEKREIINKTPNVPNLITGQPTFNKCVLTTGLTPENCRGEEEFSQLQPKVTLTYSMEVGTVFFSYGKGFKSGGFNPIGTRASLLAAPGTDPALIFTQDAYDKENSDSLEVGFKSEWADGRVRFNVALYTTEIENAQQFEFFPNAGIQAISQIDETEAQGFEVDFTVAATDNLGFFGGYGYVDTEIVKLPAASQFEGNSMPGVAEYNSFAGGQYSKPINSDLKFHARVQYTRIGAIWYDAAHTAGTMREPVGLTDLRLSLEADKWRLSLWGMNLGDKRYNSESVPLLTILQATYKAPGRSFGMDLNVKF